MSSPIVVGFDGSVTSRRAVTWAVHEARSRDLPVLLVRSYEPPATSVALGYGGVIPGSLVEDLRAEEERQLSAGVESAAAEMPGTDVSGRLLVGSPASAILREAEDASMVVLGSRGLGGFRGLLLGSVGQQVSSHASVPVVVVRGASDRQPQGRVLVAVDGSDASPMSPSPTRPCTARPNASSLRRRRRPTCWSWARAAAAVSPDSFSVRSVRRPCTTRTAPSRWYGPNQARRRVTTRTFGGPARRSLPT